MRPRLFVVWGLLGVLVAGIVALEVTGALDPEPKVPTGSFPMFRWTEADLGGVEAFYKGRHAALMRDPEGQWFLHGASHSHAAPAGGAPAAPNDVHRADPESAAKIEKQLVIAARMIADRRLRPERDLNTYGLANPQVMIAFYGRTPDGADYSKPLDVLYVGDLMTTEYAYYAMVDGFDEMLLIPRYNVSLLLATMYGEDQAPSLTPEETGTVSGEPQPGPPGDTRRF
jgi:hypothetical protein